MDCIKLNSPAAGLLIRLLSIYFVMVLAGWGFAADPPKITNEEAEALKKVEMAFKEAIKLGDYSALRSDGPVIKNPLYWEKCNGERVDFEFGQMVEKLKAISKDSPIRVNHKVFEVLSVFIETKGWAGKHTYIYFEFSLSLGFVRDQWV